MRNGVSKIAFDDSSALSFNWTAATSQYLVAKGVQGDIVRPWEKSWFSSTVSLRWWLFPRLVSIYVGAFPMVYWWITYECQWKLSWRDKMRRESSVLYARTVVLHTTRVVFSQPPLSLGSFLLEEKSSNKSFKCNGVYSSREMYDVLLIKGD